MAGFAEPVKTPPKGVATGFSGGIDSFHSLYEHNVLDETQSYPITHFFFNNMGSHGQSEEDDAVFHHRAALLRQCAQELGIPFIAINSNLDECLQDPFAKTHTMRNVIAPLLMPQHIGAFLYASGIPLQEVDCGPGPDMAYMDPALLPLLGTETLQCMGVGAQARLEKTLDLTQYPPSYRYLDVCVLPQNATKKAINCSYCWKCLRTLATLEGAGKLEYYHEVFDLERYQQVRPLYEIELWSAGNAFSEAIKQYRLQQGWQPSVLTKLAGSVLPYAITSRLTTWFLPRLLQKPTLLGLLRGIFAK